MKTPWKFLADLTSRRRPAKAPENSAGHDAEAIESEAKPAPEVPSDTAEASGATDRGAHALADSPPAAPKDAEAVREKSEESAPLVEEVRTPAPSDARSPSVETKAKPQRKPPAKRPGSAKTTRAEAAAKSAAREQSARTPSSRDPFFDEVASLDEDIRKLRSELAQKLHQQNAQLKKMLERFDRS